MPSTLKPRVSPPCTMPMSCSSPPTGSMKNALVVTGWPVPLKIGSTLLPRIATDASAAYSLAVAAASSIPMAASRPISTTAKVSCMARLISNVPAIKFGDIRPWSRWAIAWRIADQPSTSPLPTIHTSEPLRYHGLYALGELPPGQLSCVGLIQTNLQELAVQKQGDILQSLRSMVTSLLNDNAPARPDVLVLPELMLPGPATVGADDDLVSHFQQGAIEVPGPATDALVELAHAFQISLVLGVAERDNSGPEPTYYNTVLLIDPEGGYGQYLKLNLTKRYRL